jgi:hypothetical protein
MVAPAVGIAVANIIKPDVWLEYPGYIYSVQVIVINGWEWLDYGFMWKYGTKTAPTA